MTVITLSRQYASGGDEVADRLCGLLHYRYFDGRLIAELAAETRPVTGVPIDFTERQYRMPSILDLYHLIINTDLLGIAAAARLIVSAVACLQ
jgi:hypothetical protein